MPWILIKGKGEDNKSIRDQLRDSSPTGTKVESALFLHQKLILFAG